VRYKTSHDWPLAFASVVLATQAIRSRPLAWCSAPSLPSPGVPNDAEKALVGQPLKTRQTATLAGEAAVKAAQPLSRNGYKVQITKTAVKRAVMRAAGLRTV